MRPSQRMHPTAHIGGHTRFAGSLVARALSRNRVRLSSIPLGRAITATPDARDVVILIESI